jgi:hypothetical protein
MPNLLQSAMKYAAADEQCARLIVANVDKHGGDGSLMVEWARLVLRHAIVRDHDRPVRKERQTRGN